MLKFSYVFNVNILKNILCNMHMILILTQTSTPTVDTDRCIFHVFKCLGRICIISLLLLTYGPPHKKTCFLHMR